MRKYDNTEILIEAADTELRSREFKVGFVWNGENAGWITETVIKSMLAMSNTLGGGQIIIGIEEDANRRPVVSGVSEDQLASFGNYDLLKDMVDGFSSTPIAFDVRRGEYRKQDGTMCDLVVISVQEFDEVPAICRKNGNSKGVLIEGTIYARSRRGKPASTRIAEAELREIIQMAVDKQARNLERRGYTRPSESAVFDRQIADMVN